MNDHCTRYAGGSGNIATGETCQGLTAVVICRLRVCGLFVITTCGACHGLMMVVVYSGKICGWCRKHKGLRPIFQ